MTKIGWEEIDVVCTNILLTMVYQSQSFSPVKLVFAQAPCKQTSIQLCIDKSENTVAGILTAMSVYYMNMTWLQRIVGMVICLVT